MSYLRINTRKRNKTNCKKTKFYKKHKYYKRNTRKNKRGGGKTTGFMQWVTGNPEKKGVGHYFKKPFREIGLFKERLGDQTN